MAWYRLIHDLIHSVQIKVFSFLLQRRASLEKQEKASFGDDRIANFLAARETETFYASLLVWTIVMSILTFNRLALAHLPLLLVIFPLIVRVLVWENFFTTKTVDQNLGKFVFMYLLATIIPLQFFTQLAVAMFDTFVPIMGRAGSQAPPDIVMAVMCAFVVVVLTSYLVSRYYLSPHMCTELQGLISRCPGTLRNLFWVCAALNLIRIYGLK